MGYSVAYPFGVAGPILFLYLTFIFLKPKIDVPAGSGMELLEIALRRPEYCGKRLGELTAALPAEVQIAALRRDDRNQPASPDIVLAENDVLLVVAPTRAMLDEVRKTPRRGGTRPPHRRIAGTSTTCASSRPGRAWWGGCSAISSCRATRLRS